MATASHLVEIHDQGWTLAVTTAAALSLGVGDPPPPVLPLSTAFARKFNNPTETHRARMESPHRGHLSPAPSVFCDQRGDQAAPAAEALPPPEQLLLWADGPFSCQEVVSHAPLCYARDLR